MKANRYHNAMDYDYGRLAGSVIFVGAVQFVLALIIAEALYPGYSVADNTISDLGVGPSAAIFNSSMLLLGASIVVAAYLIQRRFKSKPFFALLIITGVGAMGVGLFPENVRPLHTIASLTAFLFEGLSAIASFKLQKPPLSYLAVLLGLTTLAALALYGSGTYLGLGRGGMERMIAYPALLWGVGFGGHLIGAS